MKRFFFALILFLVIVPQASGDLNTTLITEYSIAQMRSPDSWRYLKNVHYNPITSAFMGGLAFCEGSLSISIIERDDAPPFINIVFTSNTTRRNASYVIADAYEFIDTIKRTLASPQPLESSILRHKGIDMLDGSRSNYVLQYVESNGGSFTLRLDRAGIDISIMLSKNAVRALTSFKFTSVAKEQEAMPHSSGHFQKYGAKKAFLTTANVNLRIGPDETAPIIKKLKGNEWVNAYATSIDGKWTNVEVVQELDDLEGWIASEDIGFPLESENTISMAIFEKALYALGKNKSEVVERLGKPDRFKHYAGTPETDDYPYDTFFYPDVTISFHAYGEMDVDSISTTKYELLEGFPIGSSADRLKKKLGTPSIIRKKKTFEEWVYGTSGEGMYWEQLVFIIKNDSIAEVSTTYY